MFFIEKLNFDTFTMILKLTVGFNANEARLVVKPVFKVSAQNCIINHKQQKKNIACSLY